MKNDKLGRELQRIRKIINEMIHDVYEYDEHDEYDEYDIDKDHEEIKAKKALIALSKGRIPKDKIQVSGGNLSGANFDKEGHTSSSGEVEVRWKYGELDGNVNGDTEYDAIFNVKGSFYLIKGDDGYWGSSMETSSPPEPDDHRDDKMELLDQEIIIGDDQKNQYDFKVYELGSTFKEDMENFFLSRYSPLYEKIY